MSTRTRNRVAASIVAAALAFAGGVVAAPAAVAAPTGSDLDYYSHAFPGLRTDSVFEPVTFERFEYLLNSEGTYAFLIGGPADATSRATVAHIDAVAQEHGIDTVYTFDPRLDGKALDVRTTDIAAVAALWTRVVESNLNKDTAPAFGDPAADPYLFIYDSSRTAGGAEDRIIASLGGQVDAAALATEGGAAAYRAQVDAVFDAVSAADLDTRSQFEYLRSEINRKHASQYPFPEAYGAEILTAADGADFALRQVTYPELIQVLESDGDHVILFGGTWCHNTRAVVKDVNRAAAAAGVETVYFFDLRLDGASANALHIRDTASELAYLYGDLVTKYFPNLRTQYVTNGSAGQRVDFHPGGDTSVATVAAKKLQVPYLIEYDRSKGSAPIVQDWIRDNGDGTFREYMTEWWWIADLPGRKPGNQTEEQFATTQATQWAFADEALAKIDRFFGLAAAPAAPAAPTVVVAGSDATVSWVAPSNGGSALTGYRVSLDGGEPVSVAAGTTSHVFPGLAVGAHSVTVTALNLLGASAASAAAAFEVTAPAEPEPEPGSGPGSGDDGPAVDAAVTVSGDLQPGGTIVVTGTGLPASATGVQVEIRSTPQSLGTVSTTAAGTFRLETTIPASIAPGAHTVVVLVDGVVVASSAVSVTAAGGLAATGAELPIAAGAGALLLLAAGAVALGIARRRRTAS